jgi:hypothetical protein
VASRDDKSAVFEHMFLSRWDPATNSLVDALFTLGDVTKAIAECNQSDGKTRSVKNAANFAKDYMRKRSAANQRWPDRIRRAGYTIRQVTGGGNCFQFIPIAPGELPFPLMGDAFNAQRLRVQSLSMPLASKSLGRDDETWLTQVAVKLHFIEAYFALSGTPRKVVEIDHLQMGAKLRLGEIDSIYRFIEDREGARFEGLILLEAKGRKEDLGRDQLINCLKAGKSLLRGTPTVLLPMALKVIGNSEVHVMEFELVRKDEVDTKTELELRYEAVIQVVPPVPGV